MEKVRWGIQWDSEAEADQLEWPDDTDSLEPISLCLFRQALFTFPAGTGLGWGGIHPRALLRLPDDVLLLWLALFIKCEREGRWPVGVGVGVVVVVVLLPKPDGGFRPIGLIPNTPRI